MEVMNIRKVELTMNEQNKYEVIKKLVETNGDKHRAALKLGCSIRTINRLIRAYEANGKKAFSHGNKGRRPAIAVPRSQRDTIVLLYQNKYFDSNIRHFTELLAQHEAIQLSESTIRTILLDADILSPKAHKATKKAFKERLKAKKTASSSKKEQKKLQEAILSVDTPHFRRPRCRYFGERIQMDASVHLWFGDKKVYLHAAIDDATGAIVGAYFDEQETLKGYYNVFHQILSTYGIPYQFYTDRRTVFEYKQKKSPKTEEDTYTQFAYACKLFGVDLKTTSVPQAKGRIERLFGTLQSRLPIELRLKGVDSIEQANTFLQHYLTEFNAQFALATDCIKSVFEMQPAAETINLYLSVLTSRKIDNGHCIKFQNNYYVPLDENGLKTPFRKSTEAIVAQTFDGRLFCTIHDKVYALERVANHECVSRYFNTKEEIKLQKTPKKQYIPDMTHPWRKDNFMKYVYSMAGHETDWAS